MCGGRSVSMSTLPTFERGGTGDATRRADAICVRARSRPCAAGRVERQAFGQREVHVLDVGGVDFVDSSFCGTCTTVVVAVGLVGVSVSGAREIDGRNGTSPQPSTPTGVWVIGRGAFAFVGFDFEVRGRRSEQIARQREEVALRPRGRSKFSFDFRTSEALSGPAVRLLGMLLISKYSWKSPAQSTWPSRKMCFVRERAALRRGCRSTRGRPGGGSRL